MRKTLAIIFTLLLLSCLPARAIAQGSLQRFVQPGDATVKSVEVTWHDQARDRDVPAKIYYPQGEKPCATIIFSHGLGGSRHGYAYLGNHWASHGYISVHLQHHGSDELVWKGKTNPMIELRRAAANPRHATDRPRDVSFAIDRLLDEATCPPEVRGRIDADRLGVAGHSFGAFTVNAVAGQVLGTEIGMKLRLKDPRVKAGIAMSSPVTTHHAALDKAFGEITIPMLHMTGTRDSSVIGNTGPEDRRLPFDHSQADQQYLLIFKDGDHMVFSGRRNPTQLDEAIQDAIRAGSVLFWRAYLDDDAEARATLRDGGFKTFLGPRGSWEQR